MTKLEKVGYYGMVTIAWFLNIVLVAITMYLMWGWYITPVFGIAVPKIYLMFGLSWFIAMFVKTPKRENTDMAEMIGASVGKFLIILLLGWVTQAVFA